MDTNKVYGNAFAKASERQLVQACEYLSTPQTVNLIAIEAPNGGQGAYTKEQIEFILVAAYVGFKAAAILARKTYALNMPNQQSLRRNSNDRIRTLIHTGWWGCGAYGNNRQMTLLAQILAAYWAQIDELVFHTQTNEYQKDIDAALEFSRSVLSEKQVEVVIDGIVKLDLQWEKSNNT